MRRPAWLPSLADARDNVRGYCLSATVSALGAILAVYFNTPLPWFLGPMVANALASFSGLPLKGPFSLRPMALTILGILLGTSFTPKIYQQIGEWAFSFALIPIYLVGAGMVSYAYFRRVAKYDPVSSYFSSLAGGLNEMSVLGERYGGDPVKIALAHSMRILCVVIVVSLAFWLFLGVSRMGVAAKFTTLADVGFVDGSLLIAGAVGGLYLARFLRIPLAVMVGPMLVSGVLHLTSIVAVGPPTVLLIFSQLVLGTCVGARFAGNSLRIVALQGVHGVAVSLINLTITVAFAFFMHWALGINVFHGLLAFSPAGVSEMSLMSLAAGQSVAYVTTSHLLRLVLVVLAGPLLIRLVRRKTDDPMP